MSDPHVRLASRLATLAQRPSRYTKELTELARAVARLAPGRALQNYKPRARHATPEGWRANLQHAKTAAKASKPTKPVVSKEKPAHAPALHSLEHSLRNALQRSHVVHALDRAADSLGMQLATELQDYATADVVATLKNAPLEEFVSLLTQTDHKLYAQAFAASLASFTQKHLR